MRIAAIADIHGNLPALDAVLADVAACGADVTVNLGDIVSGPLWPVETAERLMPLGLPTIAGNHERQVLTPPLAAMSTTDAHARRCLDTRHLDWLATLPPSLRLADDVLCVHGTPESDLAYWLETVTPGFGRDGGVGVRAAAAHEVEARLAGAQASLVLCGHTHLPRSATTRTGTLVVNPGSVGLPAYDDDHPHRHWIENGAPHARWALITRAAAGWHVAWRVVTYDWHAAARQAEQHGRPDWAQALRTGRVRASAAA